LVFVVKELSAFASIHKPSVFQSFDFKREPANNQIQTAIREYGRLERPRLAGHLSGPIRDLE